jgi:hypothetical protein
MSLYKRYEEISFSPKANPNVYPFFKSLSTHKKILREIRRENLDPSSDEISLPKVNIMCFPTQESHPKVINP